MATIYLEKLQIPEGFEELLHDLIKEVLREQPEDINRFCHEYFCAKKENRKMNKVSDMNEFGVKREAEIERQVTGKIESVAQIETPKSSKVLESAKENKPSVQNLTPKQPTIAEVAAPQSAKDIVVDPKTGTKESIANEISSRREMASRKEVPSVVKMETSQTMKDLGAEMLMDMTNAAFEEINQN